MNADSIENELAALRDEPWERGQHYEELGRELKRAAEKRARFPRTWLGALFFSGIASGYAMAQVLPEWKILFVGEGGEAEAVLAPLEGATGPPEGLLRADSGELYRVEIVDGRLVMRLVTDAPDRAIDGG